MKETTPQPRAWKADQGVLRFNSFVIVKSNRLNTYRHYIVSSGFHDAGGSLVTVKRKVALCIRAQGIQRQSSRLQRSMQWFAVFRRRSDFCVDLTKFGHFEVCVWCARSSAVVASSFFSMD